VLGGNGSGLTGGLTLNSGTLRLDYASNTASKMANTGQLVLNGGVLQLNANATTSVTQNAGSTFAIAGPTDVHATSAGSGTITLVLGPIAGSAGATLDFSASGGPGFPFGTSTGNTNGLLGTGPAFATVVGGTTWATALAVGPTFAVAGFGSYDTNNLDLTSSQ